MVNALLSDRHFTILQGGDRAASIFRAAMDLRPKYDGSAEWVC